VQERQVGMVGIAEENYKCGPSRVECDVRSAVFGHSHGRNAHVCGVERRQLVDRPGQVDHAKLLAEDKALDRAHLRD
jgi:hypothetical protein